MTKIILTFLLVSFSSLFANESWLYKSETLENGAIRVVIDGLKVDDGFREGAERDWIAVYPKNASNAWENVIDWRWADFTPYKKGGRYHLYDGATRIKKLGEYQVRFFRNNSFKLYKAFDFRIIKKRASFVTALQGDNENPNRPQVLIYGFKRNIALPASKDWIGIYKKGDDNSWGNVIEWKWAGDTTFDGNDRYRVMYLNPKKYSPNKKYEARYFLNNSFTTHMKSKPFSTESSNNQISVTEIKGNYQNGRVRFNIYPRGIVKLKYGAKDWVGLYRKGTSNDWNNVLTWGWVKEFEDVDKGVFQLVKSIHLQKGKYDVRYFRDNSFITYKDSTFKVR